MNEKHMINKKSIIGRNVLISFPEIGIFNCLAKVDTGAYRSSLHCDAIREIEKADGSIQLHLTIMLHQDEKHDYRTSEFKKVHIKSSFGDKEVRYLIKLHVVIDNKNFISDFTLTDRSSMRHSILLGRKALNGKFIVDPALSVSK